jgi:alkanesulfonate monooxygenase SsuD/methylene tetrahydromethanopterin reductase-like flavin-dependent oxidoreductase (luciferase family)
VTRARIGVTIAPLEGRREVLAALPVEAERAGYDAFFLPEAWGYDATVLLAEAAVRTSRLALGTGILSVWSRSPATIAMAAASLAGLAPGRFTLGLGASTAQLAEGLHDVPFAAPFARMRQVVRQVRATLRGERVPLVAVPGARALKLNVAPAPDVPIGLAALADGAIRVAGEVADGWMPFLYPLSRLGDGLALAMEARAKSEEPGRPFALWASVPTVVASDEAKAREGAAWFASFYLVNMGTLYRELMVRSGFGREVAAVVAANSPKFAAAVPAEADRLLEELIVFGTPASARQRLARWTASGAAVTCLLLRPQMTPAERAFTLDAFRPMLGSGAAA